MINRTCFEKLIIPFFPVNTITQNCTHSFARPVVLYDTEAETGSPEPAKSFGDTGADRRRPNSHLLSIMVISNRN